MFSQRLARIVAIAAAVAPALWGPTATAQTIQPIIKLVPDLVVTKVSLHCTELAVTVRNDGDALLRITSPIVVRVTAVIDLESGAKTFDKALAATGLSSGQTETVHFPIAAAPAMIDVATTVDATKVITESSETNNERKTIDEQTCALLKVTDATVVEGGDVVFTATVNRPPAKDASFTWATSPGSATGGTACGGLVDFVTASGKVNFLASEAVPTPKTVRIKTCPDLANEPSEILRLTTNSFTNLYFMRSSSPIGSITNQSTVISK